MEYLRKVFNALQARVGTTVQVPSGYDPKSFWEETCDQHWKKAKNKQTEAWTDRL